MQNVSLVVLSSYFQTPSILSFYIFPILFFFHFKLSRTLSFFLSFSFFFHSHKSVSIRNRQVLAFIQVAVSTLKYLIYCNVNLRTFHFFVRWLVLFVFAIFHLKIRILGFLNRFHFCQKIQTMVVKTFI